MSPSSPLPSSLRSFVGGCCRAVYYSLLYLASTALAWAIGPMSHGWSWYFTASVIAGAAAGVAGEKPRDVFAFIAAVLLSVFSLWAGLTVVVAIVLFRTVRRAVMLSHRDPTKPRRSLWEVIDNALDLAE
ncbi:hypothetical protein [Streptomyces sp. NPDC088915]|uniref:hypothetical protein n=1 Tax=Streptomyces sp. NPDC088915 TaxID=3365912 RepID=UPI003817E5BC